MKKFFIIILFMSIISVMFLSSETWEFYDLDVLASNYDMVSDNNGDVHILWKSNVRQLSYGKLIYNASADTYSLTDSSSFNTTYSIHTRFTRPRLAVRGDGSEIHTVFMSPGPGKYLTHVWKDASGWHETIFWTYPASGTNWYTAFPAIGVDLNGNVHVVAQLWNDYVSGDKIMYWRKPVGGSWSSATTVQTNSAPWRDVSAYTDRNGGFHATWKTGAETYGIYKYAANGASLASSPALHIPNLGGTNSYQDMVSFGETFVAPNGDVHHAYMHYNDETIRHTIKSNGTSVFLYPTKAADVNNSEHGGSYAYENPWCTLGVTPDGAKTMVGWAENRGSGDVNYVNIAVCEGGIWTSYEVDNLAKINGEGRPVLAMTDTKAYMIWRRNTGYLRLAVSTMAPAQSITVSSPIAASSYQRGSVIPISWTSNGITGDVKITLRKSDGSGGYTVAASVPYNNSPYNYTVANDVEFNYYFIKVKQNSVYGVSGVFSIPGITITSDNTGKTYGIGGTIPVSWTTGGMAGTLKIVLRKSDRSGGYILADSILFNNSPQNFTIPAEATPGEYFLKIKQGTIYTESGNFNVVNPSITVTSPSSGTFTAGGAVQVAWTSVGMSGDVKITLRKSDGSGGYVLAGAVDADNSPQALTIPCNADSGTYFIKIKQNLVFGVSGNITVNPSTDTITVTRPNGGETERAGTKQTVTWNTTGTVTNVKIESSPDNGQTWTTLVESIPNTGSYSDVLPTDTPPLSTYLLRISDASDGCPIDVSDSTFTILPPLPISVITPEGGETYNIGEQISIQWTTAGITGDVKITLRKSDGSSGYTIIDAIAHDTGTYTYTIPSSVATGTYFIKVKQGSVYSDKSGVFTITNL